MSSISHIGTSTTMVPAIFKKGMSPNSIGIIDLVSGVRAIASNILAEIISIFCPKSDINELAHMHAERFKSFCCLPDGNLCNRLELERARALYVQSDLCEEFPETLLKQVSDLRHQAMTHLRDGKPQIAQQLFMQARTIKEKADDIGSKVEEYMKKKCKTFFIIPKPGKAYRGIALEDVIRPATDKDLSQNIFYHGTAHDTKELLEKETPSTFPPYFQKKSSDRRLLDSGMGTYLAFTFDKALGYAGGRKEGVLSCKVDFSKLKIAIVQSDRNLHLLVREYFYPMALKYENENLEQLEREVGQRSNFDQHLANVAAKKYFQSLGYDAIYSPSSAWAGCAYLNIFEPNVNTVRIIKD